LPASPAPWVKEAHRGKNYPAISAGHLNLRALLLQQQRPLPVPSDLVEPLWALAMTVAYPYLGIVDVF
jgi:hypothetical protein